MSIPSGYGKRFMSDSAPRQSILYEDSYPPNYEQAVSSSVFPGKTSIPAGCLWSVRVWLRADGVEHRLFGDDELWFGKDPDFNSIGDASFGRLKVQDSNQQVYNAYVGRALVTFTFRWERVNGTLYKYSLDYEAGGVGANLFEDFRMKLDADPRTLSFLVFTVPANSIPAGASHKLRVWLRSPVPINTVDATTSYVLPFNDSFVYQRIWKTDDFKLGAHLNFDALGPKMIMGFATGGPETVTMPHPVHQYQPRHESISSIEGLKKMGYDF
ncbi:hypothetical protein CC1G_08129 [Coprinopsis cinerea okayama7|uniref:Uncharacterized protein n=1 Tax=Coprinopsis cinerea (strain Okayama-7 / 130 / ATCC MYA-4618 / FGSC 9003) TaxID=240176 RepID=A8NZ10_COPC7|nr:hypothetical protein CC1G_08129 [Coprinopsis cinerea okayama7\|eukprot:XP_001837575.2 hypothetical protein CC1G_08129 [Coprinopsis cinerea okayama7\